MDFDVRVGMSREDELLVTGDQLASKVGSGIAEVLGTPALLAFMEKVSMECVQGALPKGYSTVGTRAEMDHMAATPEGMRVKVVAAVTEVDRRRIVFEVRAEDEIEPVSKLIHTRFIIEKAKFEAKAASKAMQKENQ